MPKFSFYLDEEFPSPFQQTWQELNNNHVALAGIWCLGIFVLLAIIGPLLMPYGPYEQNTNTILLPPAWDANGNITHVFGTDSLGRDILTRVLYGCRITLGTSLIMVICAMLIGCTIGAYAGMVRGLRSSLLNHLLDAVMAIPTLLIAIIIVAILGTGLVNSAWAIMLALIPQFIHHTRGLVSSQMHKDYVIAARLDGAGNWRVLRKGILPNMIEMLVVQGTMALSIAILDITALGFLNLGAQAPSPELGSMLSDTLKIAYIAPWSLAIPGAAIFLLVLSVNLIGDGLRTALRKRLEQ
ncbi:Putative peptide transport system permease protein [Saliniradius amylolyticus]|uniref:Peptide transport system permease protein n=1 Tax=Saliniradius amylolyticus TaxID=2183582 RepID=A0A2S2E247_9ALTE|nr:ABC transporter permease subunit [Saliniradius amylolyticus]AWL11330.1 Putative peptide transport system permease protein [Saliniradius amylolyticus]